MRATKFCPRCKTTKSVDEFGWRNRRRGQRQTYCKSCKVALHRLYTQASPERRERERERQRRVYERIRNDPELWAKRRAYDREQARLRRQAAKYDPAIAEQLRAAHRRWWEGVKADPERHAAFLENRRIDQALRRERAVGEGKAFGLRDVSMSQANRGRGGFGLQLDPAPLIEWIAGRSPAEVARGDETLARGLFRVLSGESKTVSIHLVDRLCVVHGHLLLHDIYDPNEYPEAFAA